MVTGKIGFVGLTLPETENTLDKNLSKMNIYTNIVSNNFVLIQTFQAFSLRRDSLQDHNEALEVTILPVKSTAPEKRDTLLLLKC